MNPLTQVKNTQKITAREAAAGISEKGSWHEKYKDSAYINIGLLPFDLTEGDILAVFAQYGEVVDVNLIRDKTTGKSRGFAFLAYEDQRSTVLAVDNLNGARVLGRTIRVDHVADYKKKKEENEEEEQRKREERGVCYAFQRGECNRGDGCKFSHDLKRNANSGWGKKDDEPAWGRAGGGRSPPPPPWRRNVAENGNPPGIPSRNGARDGFRNRDREEPRGLSSSGGQGRGKSYKDPEDGSRFRTRARDEPIGLSSSGRHGHDRTYGGREDSSELAPRLKNSGDKVEIDDRRLPESRRVETSSASRGDGARGRRDVPPQRRGGRDDSRPRRRSPSPHKIDDPEVRMRSGRRSDAAARRTRHDSESDESPPRIQQGNSHAGHSPPPTQLGRSDDSPPAKQQSRGRSPQPKFDSDSDDSQTRTQRRSVRLRYESYSDATPPRQQHGLEHSSREKHPESSPPQRRHGHDDSSKPTRPDVPSPPRHRVRDDSGRRKPESHDSSRPRQRRRSRSPRRELERNRRDSPAQRRRRHSRSPRRGMDRRSNDPSPRRR